MRRTAWVYLLVCAVLLSGCGSELHRGKFKREVEGIGAIAAEGSVLAREQSRGRLTHSYLVTQANSLAKLASSAVKQLSPPKIPPALQDDQSRAIDLGLQTSAELQRLAEHPTRAATISRRLDRIAQATTRLVG